MTDFIRDTEFSIPTNPLELRDLHLKALKPKATPFDRLVGEGLILRVNPTGRITFRFRYTLDGRSRITTIGSWPGQSLKALRAKHQEWAAKVEQGEDVAGRQHKKKVAKRTAAAEAKATRRRKKAALSVKGLADLFMAHTETGTNRRGRPYAAKTQTEYRNHLLNHIVPQFGAIPAAEVERKQIAAWLKRKAVKAPSQANHLLSSLSAMFGWAADEELIGANIVAGLKKPGSVKSKERALEYNPELQEVVDTGEIRTFWDFTKSVNPVHGSALRLILLSGLRPGEVLGAEWKNVFDDQWIVPVSQAKNRRGAHKTPLTSELKKELEKLRKLTGETPFLCPESRFEEENLQLMRNGRTGEYAPIKTPTVARLLKGRFDFESFSPHDLRRTAATHLKALGYLDAEIGMLLHHTTQDVTAIYARGDDMARKRKMLNAWHRSLKTILTGEQADNVVPIRSR